MELRAGYKQTEVGSIPEEWDAVLVGDFFTFKNGLNKAKHFFGHGTPIVNYMDVFGRPSFRIEELRGRVKVSKAELKAYEVCRGDVFFTRTSETIDEIGVASVLLGEAEQTVFSGFVLRARPTVDALVDEFKSYCFSPRYFRQQVTTRASYTTRALINGRSLSATFLAKPPKSEQTAIATALSDVDALLAGQDALIAKKRAIKQGAMQELLTGKRRLPGFSGEWEVRRLDQLADIRSGGTPSTSRPEFWDGDVLWVTPTDITALDGDKLLSDTTRKITDFGLKSSSAEIIPANSIVMTSRATIGECAINSVPLSTNQGFKNFVPNESVDVEFLYYLLTTQKKGFISLCAGSTFLEIGKTQLVGYEVGIPKKEEQVAIAEALSNMDSEITALETQRAKTIQLKQGMMQALLTGRIRLV